MPIIITKTGNIPDFSELPDKIGRIAALDSLALISYRVQNKGLKSDGTPIVSSAQSTLGRYSKSWAAQRLKKGRQIQIVDLTFSGEMMDSFQFGQQGTDYVVGFTSEQNGLIASYNEEKFGSIFELGSDENSLLTKAIQEGLNEYFKQ